MLAVDVFEVIVAGLPDLAGGLAVAAASSGPETTGLGGGTHENPSQKPKKPNSNGKGGSGGDGTGAEGAGSPGTEPSPADS